MGQKHILFDDWLEEHLENETDDYRDDYEKEKFKLELAIKIKKIRTEQNFSQREFAKKVGIAQSALANIELGNAEPNMDTMYKIGAKNNKKLVISYE